METKVYQGWLALRSNGQEANILALVVDPFRDTTIEFLAYQIAIAIKFHGQYLSVQYATADKVFTVEQIPELLIAQLYGPGDATYAMHYSDLTGYLWTDEDLTVGGHDLLAELKSYVGRYCILQVGYSKKPV